MIRSAALGSGNRIGRHVVVVIVVVLLLYCCCVVVIVVCVCGRL